MRILRWAGLLWTGMLVIIVVLAALLLGLRLLLPLVSPTPTLLDVTPANGADGVSSRAVVALRFSVPMNPRSVERALTLRPLVAWQPIWSEHGTTLTLSPTQNLRTDTTYELHLTTQALSQRFRALEQPLTAHFRTAPAPAVVHVLPADGANDVPLTSPISIQFSRTIVPTTSLTLPTQLPELSFVPPITGTVTWLDAATALFRPAEPLHPGTRYRATLAADLSDLTGTPLNNAFTWTFSTPAPTVLAVAPADGTRGVAPHATLAITLSQALDLDIIRATLSITPTIQGELSATELPDGRQVVHYKPLAGWHPSTTYLASLQPSSASNNNLVPLSAARRWSFTVAPLPALIGRFPGEGQTLPTGQEIRLVFNTPMDGAAVRQALQFSPPATLVRVTVNATDVRIAVDLRAATMYTMTLPATLTDLNGIALGQSYRLRFITAPSGPTLVLPEASAHMVQVLPNQSIAVLLQRTNVSALNFDLYQLDDAALVRTVEFDESDWLLFKPERYSLPLLHSWSLPLSDPLNVVVTDRVAVAAADGAPLAVGAYYVRIRTPEGPRADLLLLVSRTRLMLQSNAGATLIWATDVVSSTALMNLPITLYQAGVQVQQGTTDSDGLLHFSSAATAAHAGSVALASGVSFGVVSSSWSVAATPAFAHNYGFVTTDRAVYQPGDTLEAAGMVRATSELSGGLVLPHMRTVDVSVRAVGMVHSIYQAQSPLRATGVFSVSMALPANLAAGQYNVAVTLDGQVFLAPFQVQSAKPALLQVHVHAPPLLAAGAGLTSAVEVHTPQGLPVASATLSWTLSAQRAPFPDREGYVFGDNERATSVPAPRSGSTTADAQGRASIVISDTLAGDGPLQYQLLVRASEPGGPSASSIATFHVAPAPIAVGVRLPHSIWQVGENNDIELLALSPDGQPAYGAKLRIEVYNRTWERSESPTADGTLQSVWQPRDTLAFVRNIVSAVDGSAVLPLHLNEAGAYRLHVSTSDQVGQPTFSAISLWATSPGFTGWGELPGGQPLLIADHATYHAGEIATLLLVAPFTQSSVLLTQANGSGLNGQVRAIRAGEPFTITVRAEDAPGLQLAVLFAERVIPSANIVALSPVQFATVALWVEPNPPVLAVSLQPNAAHYAPGATATLTITTMNDVGAGVPADLIVGITGASAAPHASIIKPFQQMVPALVTVPARATSSLTATTLLPLADDSPPPVHSVYWHSDLQTDANGVLTLAVQLPGEPGAFTISVWAATTTAFGQTQSTVQITEPIALQLEAPPFFRVGDRVELAATVQNTSSVMQDLQLTLTATGIQLAPDSALTQQRMLGSGEHMRIAWQAQVLDVAGVSASVRAVSHSQYIQSVQFERPILPARRLISQSGGALVQNRFTQILTPTLATDSAQQLRLDLAGSSSAFAKVDVRLLAAASERSLLDEASLLLISAPYSDTYAISQVALDRLVAEQNEDGGWSWWPGSASDPFVTAVVLEALSNARASGMLLPTTALDRGIARLAFALRSTTGNADLRAHMLYVLSLYNKADMAQLRSISADPTLLNPPGLAYLLLAQSAQSSDPIDQRVFDRLIGLLERQNDLVSWPARNTGATLDTDVSATALALLALERLDADDNRIIGARSWLLAHAPNSAYTRARALAALRVSDPPAPDLDKLAGHYTVMWNGNQVIDQPLTDVLTSTRTLRLMLEDSPSFNELEVTSAQPLVLRYELSGLASNASAQASSISLLREYLDPATGQALDPLALHTGQLIQVRLTLISTTTHRFLAVTEPFPASAILVDAPASPTFAAINSTADHLTLARVTIRPGIYQYSYLLRVVVAGHYTMPAPSATAALGDSGNGRAATLDVTAR